MATRQTVQFPHVDQQGGGPGWKEQILKGLRLAAMFTEPPEHRLARQAEERRQRESQFGISADQERLAMARRRESRMERADEDAAKDKSLERALQLAQSGYRLSPEQVQGIDSGELLGLDLGSGVNTGIAGGTLIEHEGQKFFIPGRQAEQDVQLNQELDKRAAIDALGKIPLPGDLAEVTGIPEGTPIDSSSFDDLIRAAQGPRPTVRQETKEVGGQIIRFTYDDEGNIANQVSLGKAPGPKVSASEGRMQRKAAGEKFVTSQVSKIARSAKTFKEAQTLLQQAAESDEKIAGEYATIERALAEHFAKTSKDDKQTKPIIREVEIQGRPFNEVVDPYTGEVIKRVPLGPPPEPGFLEGIGQSIGGFFGSGDEPDNDPLGIR